MKTLKEYVGKGLFYKSVVEDGTDIIFIVDYSGKIIYHNASVAATLGYKPKGLVGQLFFDFILPESLPDFKMKFRTSCRRKFHATVEFQFLCKDGSYTYLEFNSINLKHNEGLRGLILDCRDIMQRKKDAEELLRAQRAKEQFLANVSHEIRTPINGITGMATLLSKNPSPEEQITYLSAIRSAADNLKVIINDILDLASTDSGKLKFEKIGFNLHDLLTTLVGSFSVQAREKNLDLSYRIEEKANRIYIGDPVRLNQILINLIGNALKFTHDGHIDVKAHVDKIEKDRCRLTFEVSDTGIGIPEDKLSTIFESFSQADASVTRKYGGTGLGLTIVKQLVELQHGSISVTSKEDEGSKFTVVIPYGLGGPGDVAEISSRGKLTSIQRSKLKNLRILLVEDNDINRLYASSILKTWECELEMAENGYVALEKLKSATFDIVLMDIQMPVMDGFEATKAIRRSETPRRRIPIIALTANASRKDIEKCLNAGMNDCISKPFTPEELFRILVKHSSQTVVAGNNDVNIEAPIGVDLSYLSTIMNGNEVFIHDIVNTFLTSMPKSLQEINHLLREEDREKLAKAIHKIKPSLTMMGLQTMTTKVLELEAAVQGSAGMEWIAEKTREFSTNMTQVLESLQEAHLEGKRS